MLGIFMTSLCNFEIATFQERQKTFLFMIDRHTLKCLSIGTPKAINFPFVSDEKLNFLSVSVFKHIVMRL